MTQPKRNPMNHPKALLFYLLVLVVLFSFLALAFLSLAEFVAVLAPGLAESPAWPDPARREALNDTIWPIFAASCMALGGILWWRGRSAAVNDAEE